MILGIETPRASLRFAGRRPGSEKGRALHELAAAIDAAAPPLSWARQVHSAVVLEARAGPCGEGDALWTDRGDLAIGVVTADCVPVLFSGSNSVAAAHAGWRGLVAGVVPRTVERLCHDLGERPEDLEAWIGPAIGPCCYEVSDQVADQVASASTSRALLLQRPGQGERPFLDLFLAAKAQLCDAGLIRVTTIAICTRCHPQLLWSHRREGVAGGRNLSFLWRKARQQS